MPVSEEEIHWERQLRMKIAFICIAVLAKEGDNLRKLTDDLAEWLREKR